MPYSFQPADILLPAGADLKKWSVVACDQFTSEPDYWREAAAIAGDSPSALDLILPELAENEDNPAAVDRIVRAMEADLAAGIFKEYPRSFTLVERTLSQGGVRTGLVGAADLAAYDFAPGSTAAIRATEGTVAARLPARASVRRRAPLELSHVLLICRGAEKAMALARQLAGQVLYDFPLMLGGGRVRGRLISGGDAGVLAQELAALTIFVGDGNHSLAAAKLVWQERGGGDIPCRYALAELVDVSDPGLTFLPIHRILTGCDPAQLRALLSANLYGETACRMLAGGEEFELPLPRESGGLSLLQPLLDEYAAATGSRTDYVHDPSAVEALSRGPEAAGLILPPPDPEGLLSEMEGGRLLPRKTFSLGHARDKRYYLEARKIR